MTWKTSRTRLVTAATLFGAALTMAGCMTTAPVGAKAEIRETIRVVVGTDLIGARGATARDQRKIDVTAAGLCNAQVWTGPECRRHGERGQ
ncbi:MAG: hypothetical protein CML67_06245 [Rhodobacteraceae bacterium]|nr:hypothetical protein [Paracoccaceae bacterium]